VNADIQFTATLGELTDALNGLAVAIVSRRGLPVMAGVLITSDGEQVTLSTFDYETSIRVQLDAHVTGTGRVLVPHAELLKLCRGAAKGDTVKVWRQHHVELAVVGGEVTLSVAGFVLPVDAMPVEDYPVLPAAGRETVESFIVDRDVLLAEVKRLCVSAGDDDTLPMLKQVNLQLEYGTLTAATTNRFQMGVAEIPVQMPEWGGTRGQWNVPAALLLKVAKLLPSGLVTVQLPQPGERITSWITVSGGALTATLNLFDDEYVRYRQVLNSPQTTATANRAELLRATVKAEAMSSGRPPLVRVEVTAGSLTVVPGVDNESTRRPVGRSVSAETDLAHGHLEFAFNPAYLRSALEVIDGDQVAIGFTPGKEPALFAGDAADLQSLTGPYLHLVMPVNLPDPPKPPVVPAPRVVTASVGSAL
jgi:DNA polymerase-3 subunit beta